MVCRMFTFKVFFSILCSIIILTNFASADHGLKKGEIFTDPDVVQEMSDEWIDKQVEYKDEVKGFDLVIDLNQQIYPFIKPLVEKFATQKNIKVAFSEGTCGKSSGHLDRKEVDMGGFCCPAGKLDRLPGLKFHTIGITPLSILVHPDNPVDDLSFADIRKIFSGKVIRWSELGGNNQIVRVIASLHCKKRPGHWKLLLKDQYAFSPRIIEEGDMSDTIALIAATPEAIGYEVLIVADRFKHRGKVKALKVNGKNPRKPDVLLDRGYPLYRTYTITTWEGKSKNIYAQELVEFLIKEVETIEDELFLVSASKLRKAGWKFKGNELVGEPE